VKTEDGARTTELADDRERAKVVLAGSYKILIPTHFFHGTFLVPIVS
jgi:hypothetical protein